MKRSWILGVSTIGLMSGLLLGTVALGRAEPKVQSGDVAKGKTLFGKYCTGCHGPEPTNALLPAMLSGVYS